MKTTTTSVEEPKKMRSIDPDDQLPGPDNYNNIANEYMVDQKMTNSKKPSMQHYKQKKMRQFSEGMGLQYKKYKKFENEVTLETFYKKKVLAPNCNSSNVYHIMTKNYAKMPKLNIEKIKLASPFKSRSKGRDINV